MNMEHACVSHGNTVNKADEDNPKQHQSRDCADFDQWPKSKYWREEYCRQLPISCTDISAQPIGVKVRIEESVALFTYHIVSLRTNGHDAHISRGSQTPGLTQQCVLHRRLYIGGRRAVPFG